MVKPIFMIFLNSCRDMLVFAQIIYTSCCVKLPQSYIFHNYCDGGMNIAHFPRNCHRRFAIFSEA